MGPGGHRVYLDWNATAPLRPEARAAMFEAMDAVGNPSSVHAEGRAAKAIIEKSRSQVADLVGCDPDEVVFTSGATEALGLAIAQDWNEVRASPVEHDAVAERATVLAECPSCGETTVGASGRFDHSVFVSGWGFACHNIRQGDAGNPRIASGLFALTAANSETGVIQNTKGAFQEFAGELQISEGLCDATQAVGKIAFGLKDLASNYAGLSGHKIGAPKGTGALVVRAAAHHVPKLGGGGQEKGRRSGTENVVGIAGFGAAAESAQRDLASGVWDRVEKLRNILEETLEAAAPDLLIFGRDVHRLPNTSCFAVPGWKGETQVMQMDLAGFAISAGSACSSGKVRKASRVLLAMGFDEVTASSAIRVSLGPTTTEAQIRAFADVWIQAYRRRKARAA